MTLPEALAAARGGRAQQEVADACGVSQVTISSWEAGETKPRFDKLRAVAKAYGLAYSKVRSLWMRSVEAAA